MYEYEGELNEQDARDQREYQQERVERYNNWLETAQHCESIGDIEGAKDARLIADIIKNGRAS